MKKILQSDIVSIGLAIFSMFFGAGNLIYPIKVGMNAGQYNCYAIAGFLLTAVLLPLFGLIAMILFDGNYKAFLFRLGKIPGYLLLIACMLIIGPGIAIPRIITLSHTMMEPFLPSVSVFVFSLIFLGITFLCTFRENKIVDLLGKYISPLLLISLAIIVVKGFMIAQSSTDAISAPVDLFKKSFRTGFETLDLLGAIFFGSIILHILKNTVGKKGYDNKQLAYIGLKSGLLGISLLAIVYIGMSYLGVYHSYGLGLINPGLLFSKVSFRVLGCYGAAIIGLAVFMACLSTSIALSAVVGEFVQKELFRSKITFLQSLILVLVASIPLSIFGLDTVLELTAGPIIYIGYPMLIVLTFVNIAYKLWGFKSVKIPVVITGLIALATYLI